MLRLALVFAGLTGAMLTIAIGCYIQRSDAAALISAILAAIYFVFMEVTVHFYRLRREVG